MRRLLLVFAAALALPPPAGAAVQVRNVDASAYPEVRLTVLSPTRPVAWDAGRRAAGLEVENLGRAKSVVLAVDNSQSMRGKPLADAVAAARAFVGRKAPGDRVAIVGFGSRAVQLTRFSSATIDSDLALRGLSVDARQGTALYDAVALGARALAAEPLPARVLVVVTDGTDVSSSARLEDAVAAVRAAGVTAYAVGIESEQFAPEPLRALAEATGGAYRGAASSAALAQAYAEIAAELRRTWVLRYLTAARPGEEMPLQVSAPGAGTIDASFTAPGRRAASAVDEPLLPREALTSSWAPAAVGLAVGALLLAAVALLAAARRGSWLRERLAPHVGSRRARAERPTERFAAGSALLRATEGALGHLRWWRGTHRLLEQADAPLSTAEFLYLALGCGVGTGLLAAVSGRSSLLILAAMGVGAAAPFGWMRLRARRRLRAFENQLPDLLLALAASLKAGHSFKQGLQTIVDEGAEPAAKEFKRVLAEAQLGRPLEAGLEEMAERVRSKNLGFVINAVAIQSQVGGSLAGLFDLVAEAVRQRQQFARKIRGLTAMGRASAYVLVGLPFFTAAMMTLINPEFMDPLYTTPAGHKLLGAGLVMMTIGSLLLRKIVSFRG